MCGRFYIAPQAELEKTVTADQPKIFADLPVKYSGEIFPTDIVPVYIAENGRRRAKPLIWGFPRWDNEKAVVFNARQETALEKSMFRDSLLKRRVAVLTCGFFEWKSVPGQKKKDRFIFTLTGEKFLFLAGVWNGFTRPTSGLTAQRFTILTTNANESMTRYHNRMPVVLSDSEVDDWLIGEDFRKYLEREQSELDAAKID